MFFFAAKFSADPYQQALRPRINGWIYLSEDSLELLALSPP